MTRVELAAKVAAIKAEMVQRRDEGDEAAQRWLDDLYPGEFPRAATHWTDRETGED